MSTFIRPKNVKILHLFGRKMQILVSVPEIPLSGMVDSTCIIQKLHSNHLLKMLEIIWMVRAMCGRLRYMLFIGLRTM